MNNETVNGRVTNGNRRERPAWQVMKDSYTPQNPHLRSHRPMWWHFSRRR